MKYLIKFKLPEKKPDMFIEADSVRIHNHALYFYNITTFEHHNEDTELVLKGIACFAAGTWLETREWFEKH